MELKYGEETAPPPPAPEPQFEQDPDPGYEETPLSSFRDKIFGTPSSSSEPPKRVTAAMKKDIRGKLAFGLAIAPVPFQSRDPLCVEAFRECIPDRKTPEGEPVLGLASALTEIICDSPEMVRFFSTGGRYMKWLQLMMAFQPFAKAVVQHHVTHSVGDEDQELEDWTQYRV